MHNIVKHHPCAKYTIFILQDGEAYSMQSWRGCKMRGCCPLESKRGITRKFQPGNREQYSHYVASRRGGIQVLTPGTWYPVPGTGTRYLVPGTGHQVPGI